MSVRPGVLMSLLVVSCGGTTPPAGGGSTVTTTADAPVDAAVAGPAVTGPAPGSAGDVLGRIFPSDQPEVPRAFGSLRPGMARSAAAGARPAAWGQAWELAHPDEPGVTIAATIGDGADDKIESLSVAFEQVAAVKRLELAWGPADATAFNAATACWLNPPVRLKACYVEAIDRHAIELGSYMPLDEAIGKGGRRALAELVPQLGAGKKEVARAFPDAIEIRDDQDPSRNRLEVRLPPTEYSADIRPDKLSFFLDGKDRVREVALRFGANDPALRPALIEALRAAAKPLAVDVTIVEDEPVDVVVLLDRDEGLR